MRESLLSGVKPWLLDESLTRPDWVDNQPRANDRLWLDKNENSDPRLLEVTSGILRNLDPRALFSYPDSGPLYRKLAAIEGVSPRQLRLTPGSDGGIRIVFEVLLQPGDTVLHTTPTFAMYPVYCQMFGVRAVPLGYRRSPDGPLLHADEIIEAIRLQRPKLVCLPNPDSPTGTFFSQDSLARVLQAARDCGSFVLIDEAYYPFHPETAAPLLSEFDNLIVARTFAKAWGLAGLRVGYTIASEELTKIFHKVRPMYEVSTLAVAFIEKMLDRHEDVPESVRRICEGREYFIESMRGMGFHVIPSAGNFCHVAFGKFADAIHLRLREHVLYRHNSTEECLRGYSRFSATTREVFQTIVGMIRDVVERDSFANNEVLHGTV